jgi:uncharacterized OB-fold protein
MADWLMPSLPLLLPKDGESKMQSNESVPLHGGVQATYQAALDAGQFTIQRCSLCTRHVFFPREFCPHCGGDKLTWIKPRGGGTVYAVTTVRRKQEAGGDYNVSLVDLDESVRVMSRIEGVPIHAVKIGQRVQARVAINNGRGVVLFDAINAKGEGA